MKRKKIMIVEDEVIFGIDLIEKLEKLGYQPDPNVIRYGKDVMDAAQKSKPDLILMDINLKGEIDGIQAALSVQDNLNIPVIFLTAFSDKKTLRDAKKAGPYAFLKKPVMLENLKITLEIALYKAKIENRLKEKVMELQEALDNIKTLKGLIPICSNCKNIRDDKGYWNNLESYIQNHSEALFSHSMCPTCMEECYGGEEWYIEMKQERSKKKKDRG